MPKQVSTHSCAIFCRPIADTGDPNPGCTLCGWNRADHLTFEQLDAAHKAGRASLIVDKCRFKMYVYDGFKFICNRTLTPVYSPATGRLIYDIPGWGIREKSVNNWKPKSRAA